MLQQANIICDFWQSDSPFKRDIAERILQEMSDDELHGVYTRLWNPIMPQPVRLALARDVYEAHQPWHFSTPLEEST
jgi:hypothetical protein